MVADALAVIGVAVVTGAGVAVDVVCKLSDRVSTGAGVAIAEVVALTTGAGACVVAAMPVPLPRDSKGAGGCDEHATKPIAPKISPKKCSSRIFLSHQNLQKKAYCKPKALPYCKPESNGTKRTSSKSCSSKPLEV